MTLFTCSWVYRSKQEANEHNLPHAFQRGTYCSTHQRKLAELKGAEEHLKYINAVRNGCPFESPVQEKYGKITNRVRNNLYQKESSQIRFAVSQRDGILYVFP